MKPLRDHLQDADPLAEELPLRSDEVLRMRQQLLASCHHQQMPRRSSTRVITVAVATGVCAAAAAMLLQSPSQVSNRDGRGTVPAAAVASGNSGVQRVYFETPGGTRIIWLFQPESSERTRP